MKKLNKKGFTLIELLAVIVILAILIVLAVPAVLSIRENSNKDLAKVAAASYLKSVQMCISAEDSASNCASTAALTDTMKKYYDGEFTSVSAPTVSISGDKVTSLTFVDPKTKYTVTVSDATNGLTAADVEGLDNSAVTK